MTAAWHTAPHKTTKDLFERELIVGGTAGVDPETTPRLFNLLLGTKFKIINGYPGTTEIIGGNCDAHTVAALRRRPQSRFVLRLAGLLPQEAARGNTYGIYATLAVSGFVVLAV